MSDTYVLITNDATLSSTAEHWQNLSAVILDTEFVRTHTFYPKLGLIQLSDGNTTWLIDVLGITDFSPLVALLTNRAITKVFHACSEDLEVLYHRLGVIPAPLFDTQVAAAFCGWGFSRGYAALVQDMLSVSLDKHETRSDWLQRPLSSSQLAYAAEDVHYLGQLYQKLHAALRAKDRLAWFMEDMAQQVASAGQDMAPEDYYQKIKAAWKLSGPALARLQQLCAWREREARVRDKPRNRIVADKDLLEIARHNPGNRKQLAATTDMHPHALRLYGDPLLELLANMQNTEVFPEAFPAPLPRESRKVQAACRVWVDKKAAELGMAPEVLARKKDLEPIARSYLAGHAAIPQSLASGWRCTVVGKPLLTFLACYQEQ